MIATRLRGGRTMIRVLGDAPPGVGFVPVEAGLEDVSFATLYQQRQAASPQTALPQTALPPTRAV